MDAVESLEEVLREWSCDDFKSFYEDVFPFANSHDATVPETILDLLSNNSGFFDEMTDLSEKYDTMEPEEALFRLLQEDESVEKANCEVGIPSPKQGQGHVVVTNALQKDASSIKESRCGDMVLSSTGSTASEVTKTTSAVTYTLNEVKDNSKKKRKRKASNRGSQTKWKQKKPKGQTHN